MLISIIIATYNASKTLKTCLDSIVPQLCSGTELIIVDGGSKDNTNDIIKSYGDKVSVHISEPDKGIYDAWNKGVALSNGDWIMFIGADDILLPNAVSTYLNTIKNTADIDSYDYICAHNEYVNEEGKLLKVLGEEPKWNKMRRYMAAAHVASLHNRKNLFNVIGLYNLNLKICADYELLLRKKDTLNSLFINAHIAKMKVGGMSFSISAINETKKIREMHHSVNALLNNILYVRDLFAFELFKLRKGLLK
ncbi:glycosyltransferase family 2 protein [uncultured Prevotella sp.]|uniref:glycosyltransferase family 2 protein n=1 Tax=uncultured Prevotella sp. TaxID=159272 RepID=UPI00260C1676|nr:glycosyltransferase family 2 protein [uncultured Prevotella sp.]